MPYAPHMRLTLNGTFGAPGSEFEAFSFGLALDTGGPAVANGIVDFEGMDAAQVNDIVTDCTAFFTRAGTGIHNVCHLTEIKIANIGTDGHYVSDPIIRNVDVQGGGGSGELQAPQVALAVSLVGSYNNRTRRFGRFYLPGPAEGVELTTGQNRAAFRDAVQASAAQFITDLNNEPGLDTLGLRVVVASKTKGNIPVDKVSVGRTLDTIRSRRRSIKELYTTSGSVAS